MGGIAVGVDIVHDPTDEEWLVCGEEPHPQHEHYARYAVNGAKVGHTPELVVVGAHDGWIAGIVRRRRRGIFPREYMFFFPDLRRPTSQKIRGTPTN